MQSNGYLETKLRPGAVVAVIAIHAIGIGALLMIAPTVVEHFDKPLIGEMIDAPKIPPEIDDKVTPKTMARTALPVDRPERRIDSKPTGSETALTNDPGPLTARAMVRAVASTSSTSAPSRNPSSSARALSVAMPSRPIRPRCSAWISKAW